MKRTKLIISCIGLALLIGACGNNSGTTENNQNNSKADDSSEISTNADAEEYTGMFPENEDASDSNHTGKELILDGLWKLDRIEGIADETAYNEFMESESQSSYAVLGNHVYSFVEGKGIAGRYNLNLQEMDSKESPVDIGYCNKYEISSGKGSNIGFFSDDVWVTPVEQKDGSILSFVYKKTPLTKGGQQFTENAKKDVFTEPTVDFSLQGVSFKGPESWNLVKEYINSDTMRLFVPTGKSTEYGVAVSIGELLLETHNLTYSEYDSSQSRIAEELSSYAEAAKKQSKILEETSETEITTYNGYLCAKFEGRSVNDQTFEYYALRLSSDRVCIFWISLKDGIERQEQNERAIISSLKEDNAEIPQLIQTCNQDPNKSMELQLKNAELEEGNDGIPILHAEGDFTPRLYYGRSDSVDPINVRLECLANGGKDVSSVYSIGLGETLELDGKFSVTPDNQGIWVLRVINDDTGEVLTEKIIETNYSAHVEPEKQDRPEIGMTAEEVEATAWGKPDRKNITEAYYGTHEQWVYEGKGYVYLDDGIVTSIQWTED